MNYIKAKVNKILLVALLCLCLGCEKKSALSQNNTINNELNDINIDVLHTMENNNNFLITINIENKSNEYYCMIYDYEGDLDKKTYPEIKNINKDEVEISYYPFYSEIVNKHREEQEDRDPPVISSDVFIFFIISPHKKEEITFSIKYDLLKKYETKRLKLYFSKYKNEDSLNSRFIRISPTKDAMSYYNFKEKLIEIR
ncbi:MAG: hypothetical protein HG457_002480 [Flavobacteriaceae bacterium]|nr:hypothetical protein [Flavobacteriaceae bacterium]